MIILEALPVKAHIGTLPGEIDREQPLQIRAELSGDFRQAGISDDLKDTFDYSRIESRLAELVQTSRFHLLEALAEHLAGVRIRGMSRIVFLIGGSLGLGSNALARADEDGFQATDEAALLEHAGIPVRVVLGSPANIKITRPEDLRIAEALLAEDETNRTAMMKISAPMYIDEL